MKNYLLGLSLAAFACICMGQEMYGAPASKTFESPDLPNASAKDTTPFALTTTFQEVPFSQDQEVAGPGITVLSDTEFQLDKGIYVVSYSGSTVFADPDPEDLTTTFLTYSLNLDTIPVIQFNDSEEGNFDNQQLKTFTMQFAVPWTSVMSIQASMDPATPDGFTVTLANRTIAIVKVG